MWAWSNELVVYNMCHRKALILTFKLCDTNLSLLFNNGGFFSCYTNYWHSLNHLMTHDVIDWHFFHPYLCKDDLIIQAHWAGHNLPSS